MKYLFSLLCLSVFLLSGTAYADTVFIDCPSIQIASPSPPGVGNANSTPCVLPTPAGTITDLSLTYKYSLTAGLNSGSGLFDHNTNNAVLTFFDNGAPVLLSDPANPTTGNIVRNHLPSAAELAALATNGSLNMQWNGVTPDVLTLSGDFRWTITFTPTTVPEASPLVLLGIGLIGTAALFRLRRASES